MSRTPAQTDALEQLWAITASETEAARARDEQLLRDNGWNIQVRDLPSRLLCAHILTTALSSPSLALFLPLFGIADLSARSIRYSAAAAALEVGGRRQWTV